MTVSERFSETHYVREAGNAAIEKRERPALMRRPFVFAGEKSYQGKPVFLQPVLTLESWRSLEVRVSL
jgi:hypothetical protein